MLLEPLTYHAIQAYAQDVCCADAGREAFCDQRWP